MAIGLLLTLSGVAFGQVSPFKNVILANHTQILPAIGRDDTSIVIRTPGSCPGSPVDLQDDGVIVQKISVASSGPTLKLTRLTLTNLGSAPAADLGGIPVIPYPSQTQSLVIYDLDSKKCIATAPAISTPGGVPFSAVVTFAPAFELTGNTLAIALQAKTANNWFANQLGDTIHLRAHIGYQSIQTPSGLISNFSTTIESAATFTLGLGALSWMGPIPSSELIPVNTNPLVPLRPFQFAVDAANQGRNDPNYGLALVDVCVLNIGSASAAQAINSVTLSSTGTTPPTVISGTGTELATETTCAGASATGSFNGSGGLGVSLQTQSPSHAINSIIPVNGTNGITNFTLEIRLNSRAGLGQTLHLQTAFILALRSGSVQTKVPGGVSPRLLMSRTLTIESGRPHLGLQDATVIIKSPGQDYPPTTTTTLEASNFKAPGGIQSFSARLSYDPVMVQIAGSLCDGIQGQGVQTKSGIFYQTEILHCQVDHGRGRASFTVNVKSGSPPTAGLAPMVRIALQASVQANASASALITLAVPLAADKNKKPISVTATPGLVRFSPGGDLNADRQIDIADVIILAKAIIKAMAVGCDPGVFAGLLTVPQLEEADVSHPFAVPTAKPHITPPPIAKPPIFTYSDFYCRDIIAKGPNGKVLKGPNGKPKVKPANITSADVAAIVRRALSVGGASALQALAQLQPELNLPSALQVRALTLRGVAQGGSSVALIAHGQGITGLELRLYDLAGRLVLGAQASGQRLSFRLADKLGRPLARGVYLYVVKVRGFNGKIWRSQVRKLFLR